MAAVIEIDKILEERFRMLSQTSSSVNTASTQSQSSTSSGVQQHQHQEPQQQQHYNDDEEQNLPRMIMTEEDDYDSCSLASDVPSLDRSSSDSSDGSSNQDSIAPLGMSPRLKPRLLRQRNSGLNNDSSSSHPLQTSDSVDSSMTASAAATGSVLLRSDSNNPGVPAVAVDFIPQFLLPHNMGAPIPKGPVRKHSDFEQGAYKGVDVSEPYYDEAEPADLGVGRFRRRDEIVLHFMVELNMLWRDLLVFVTGFLFQWFHSIFTNIAYYYHTHLSAAQRVPLKDVAYDVLPLLSGKWWMVSEYLVLSMILVYSLSVFSILLIRWNAPHGRPLYCIPILRRTLMTLTVCQVLRCISFLVTTLPGASRQCLYEVPHDMSREEMMFGPAHERGNPGGWAPPITMNDILFRVDATNGCGDLMFSSHTIFTMLFVCAIWRYFNWGILKWSMLAMQVRTNTPSTSTSCQIDADYYLCDYLTHMSTCNACYALRSLWCLLY